MISEQFEGKPQAPDASGLKESYVRKGGINPSPPPHAPRPAPPGAFRPENNANASGLLEAADLLSREADNLAQESVSGSIALETAAAFLRARAADRSGK